MKRLLLILISLLASVAIVILPACQPSESPEVKFVPTSETEIVMGSEGGNFSVSYEITNPVAGALISISGLPEWINGVDQSEEGKISFSVVENTSEDFREAVFSVQYNDDANLSFNVTVRQAGTSGSTPDGTSFESLMAGDISVGPEGGQIEILYELTNPAQDGQIKAMANVDWISSEYDFSTDGKVVTEVEPNTGESQRTGTVTLTYSYSEGTLSFTVKVVQFSGSDAFRLEVISTELSTAKCRVTPLDKEMQYVSLVVKHDIVDGFFDDHDAWFADDIQYFSQMAALYEVGLKEYMDTYILQQGDLEFEASSLQPSYKFYLYAYGMEFVNGTTPTRLTSIYTLDFETKSPESTGEFQIEAKLRSDGFIACTYIPPTEETFYYYDCMRDPILSGIGTIEEQIIDKAETLISQYLSVGFTIEQIGWYGAQSKSFPVWETGVNYYPCAFELSEEGKCVSKVCYLTIPVSAEETAKSAAPLRQRE